MKRLLIVPFLLFAACSHDPHLTEGTVVEKAYYPAHEVYRTGGCEVMDSKGNCYSYHHYWEHVPEDFVIKIEGTVTNDEGKVKVYHQRRHVYQALFDKCRAGQKWREDANGADCIAQ